MNTLTGLSFHAAMLISIEDCGHHFTIPLDPQPTQRSRSRAIKKGDNYIATTYNPTSYTKYKAALTKMIGYDKAIKPGNYKFLYAAFILPFPKSTAKKHLIEGAYKLTKPDWDNFAKALADALEQSGIIPNDSQIGAAFIEKKYTLQSEGRIEFSLIEQ